MDGTWTRRDQVLAYVLRDPGCTARDIAREVFGGTGDTRTTERTAAHKVLRELREQGDVECWLPEGSEGNGRVAKRWRAVRPAGGER